MDRSSSTSRAAEDPGFGQLPEQENRYDTVLPGRSRLLARQATLIVSDAPIYFFVFDDVPIWDIWELINTDDMPSFSGGSDNMVHRHQELDSKLPSIR